jgi:hypothetical protein
VTDRHGGGRLCFGLVATLGVAILIVRRFVPEGPRWLVTHGRVDAADAIVSGIEGEMTQTEHLTELPHPGAPIAIRPRGAMSLDEVVKTYPKRAVLSFSLMVGQAFF